MRQNIKICRTIRLNINILASATTTFLWTNRHHRHPSHRHNFEKFWQLVCLSDHCYNSPNSHQCHQNMQNTRKCHLHQPRRTTHLHLPIVDFQFYYISDYVCHLLKTYSHSVFSFFYTLLGGSKFSVYLTLQKYNTFFEPPKYFLLIFNMIPSRFSTRNPIKIPHEILLLFITETIRKVFEEVVVEDFTDGGKHIGVDVWLF